MPYQSIVICDGSKNRKETIAREYLLMLIGTSQILSTSMFIDPIHHAQRILKHDQCIELLAFIASFLNNPFWFDYIMAALLERHANTHSDFQFGRHPFFIGVVPQLKLLVPGKVVHTIVGLLVVVIDQYLRFLVQE